MKEKFQQLWKGRYGVDELAVTAIIIGIGLDIVSLKTHSVTWVIISGVLILYCSVYRVFSKNIHARVNEREQFIKIFEPMRQFFQKVNKKAQNKTHYTYIICPHCGKKMKVPKNKGKIKVTCPYCKNQFIEKT